MNKVVIHDTISLGISCFSAQFLKKYSLRSCSYPFDWVFSNPDMIIDCLSDKFNKFLDKKYYKQYGDHHKCSHQVYDHTNGSLDFYMPPMFFHHNPLDDNDYQYYVRCVGRLLNVLKRDTNKLFLITYIGGSHITKDDVLSNKITSLKSKIDSLTSNAYLVIVNCITEGTYNVNFMQNNIIIINLLTSKIVGTEFHNQSDWLVYKNHIDNLFTFKLAVAPDSFIEKDPF